MVTDMQQMWEDLYMEVVAEKYKTRHRREMLYSRDTNNLTFPGNELPVFSESRARNMYDDLRTKLYDRRCGFLEWSESEDNKGIDSVSQLPLSHIHLACHDLVCYKLDGSKAKTDCEDDKVGIEFWKEFNANLPIIPKKVGNILVSGSYAEGVDLPLSMIDTQIGNFSENSDVIDNSDKDILQTPRDFVVGFQEDKQQKIVGIVETEKCRPGYLRLRVVNSDPLDKFPSILRNRYVDGITYITRYGFRLLTQGIIPIDIRSNGVNRFAKLSTNDLKGPSINVQLGTLLNSGIQDVSGKETYSRLEVDLVLGFKCVSWPPIASEWIHRTRLSGWPTDEFVNEIVSEGCHVVAAAHHFSEEKDLEFRFSFSLAEVALFQVMSKDQKKCYALFKAIVRRALEMRHKLRNPEVKLKSYHLKTIFLWSCETIPQHAWNTTSGWTRCFLFLIDQLSICLNQHFLPGYFIPQYNLLDIFSTEILNDYATLVNRIRINPIYYAAELLSKMMLYRESLNMIKRLHTSLKKVSKDEQHDDQTILGREVKFLQDLLISFDELRKFKKKSIILQMFANWCSDKSRSGDVISSSKFLFERLSLFDVVYLDIVHNINVSEDTLSACAERETSQHLISRLASLYCSFSNENSDHKQKSFLLFETSIRRGCRGSNSLLYGTHLFSVHDYDGAERMLRIEFNSEKTETNVFNQVCSTSLFKDQIWVREELHLSTANDTEIYLSSNVLVCYLLIKCYLKLGRVFDVDGLIVEMKTRCEALNHTDKYFNYHLLAVVCSELGREAFSREASRATIYWKTRKFAEPAIERGILHTNDTIGPKHDDSSWSRSLLFFQILILIAKVAFGSGVNPLSEFYLQLENLLLKFEKCKIESIPISADIRVHGKNTNRRKCLHGLASIAGTSKLCFKYAAISFPEKASVFRKLADLDFDQLVGVGMRDIDNLKFSGSFLMKCVFLSLTSDWSNTSAYTASWKLSCFIVAKWVSMRHKPTPANKTYFAQFLLNSKNAKVAIPILEEVIELESTAPMSILIWPEELKYSVDACVRKEINKCEQGYLVLPTVVYACYLLCKVYFAFGKTDSYSRTIQKFEDICKIFEDGSPVSYFLLHYARGLSGQDTQSQEIKNKKANATEIIVSRDQIFNQIFSYRQEVIYEMLQSYLDESYDNFLKGSDIREGLDFFLALFDDPMTSDDCYICKMEES